LPHSFHVRIHPFPFLPLVRVTYLFPFAVKGDEGNARSVAVEPVHFLLPILVLIVQR